MPENLSQSFQMSGQKFFRRREKNSKPAILYLEGDGQDTDSKFPCEGNWTKYKDNSFCFLLSGNPFYLL